jgi:hypothetical protein
MGTARAVVTSQWTWLLFLALVLIVTGLAGTFGAFAGAIFTPDALTIPSDIHDEAVPAG